MLLTAGADPNEHNEHGALPLHTAVSVLAEDVAEVLIAAGARVDARSILVYEYNSRVRASYSGMVVWTTTISSDGEGTGRTLDLQHTNHNNLVMSPFPPRSPPHTRTRRASTGSSPARARR